MIFYDRYMFTSSPRWALLFVLFLTIIYKTSSNSSGKYSWWRLSARTLSSEGWETYISLIVPYDSNYNSVGVVSNSFSSNVNGLNFTKMFDGDINSVTRFPIGRLPVLGDYIQWQLSVAANITAIRMVQGLNLHAGNNILGWDVMYSDCSSCPFTIKWIAKFSPGDSTSYLSAYLPTVGIPCVSPSLSPSMSPSESISVSVYVAAVGGCLLIVAVIGCFIFYYQNKYNNSKVAVTSQSASTFQNDVVDVYDQNKPCEVVGVINKNEYRAGGGAKDFDKPRVIRTDVFLSHDWGMDELKRNNHDRIRRISNALKNQDIATWFDEECMKGDIRERMTEGIENTKVILVFVTERYMNKVNNNPNSDNCRYEFDYAFRRKGAEKLIPVVMERGMRNQKLWTGRFGGALGNLLYFNFADDEDFDDKIRDLKGLIFATIHAPCHDIT